MSEPVLLSEILVGDLVTPHGPTDPFEYDGSVLVLDDVLARVDLPSVLGEYPGNPSATSVDAEQLSVMRDVSAPAPTAEDLLSWLDDDTLIPSGERGLSNLMTFAAAHEPSLLSEADMEDWGSAGGAGRRAPEASPVLVLVVLVLLVVLLAAGAWVAVRAVSGY